MSIIRSLLTRLGAAISLFFDEPEVARYVTIAETLGGFQLPNPVSDHHFRDIHALGLLNGTIPVLLFRTKHAGRPTYSVRLNSTTLIVHAVADEDAHHTWHLFIPPGALKTHFNELVLNVSGDGSVTFSDVAILYRSNQLTVRRPRVIVASPT